MNKYTTGKSRNQEPSHALTNRKTGETDLVISIVQGPKNLKKYTAHFHRCSELKLSQGCKAFLFDIQSFVCKGNLVYVNSDELAKFLGLGRSTIYRYWDELYACDVVRQTVHGWLFNPSYILNGGSRALNEVRESFYKLPAHHSIKTEL